MGLWQSSSSLDAIASSSGSGAAFRKSCPEIRRVQSMGEVLTASRSKSLCASGRPPLRGILKTAQQAAAAANNGSESLVGKEPGSEALTEEESDSDNSLKVVRRANSLDERDLTPPVQHSDSTPTMDETTVPTELQPEQEEEALFF